MSSEDHRDPRKGWLVTALAPAVQGPGQRRVCSDLGFCSITLAAMPSDSGPTSGLTLWFSKTARVWPPRENVGERGTPLVSCLLCAGWQNLPFFLQCVTVTIIVLIVILVG